LQVVLLSHVVATLFMCGVIWFVQIVHYPLFSSVGTPEFRRYEHEHARRTAWVVAPVMLLEMATALTLVVTRPAGVPAWLVLGGMGLLALVWLSTVLAQVPRHRVLEAGFDARAHRALVRGNWLRTLGWSARGAVIVAMLTMARGV